MDRLDEALDAFRRALRIGEELGREDPTFLASEPVVLTKIGHTLYRAQRPAEALPMLLRARDRWKGVLGDRTYPMSQRAYQGDNLLRLGEAYQALGRPGEALDHLRQAETIHRALCREDPKMYWYQCSLALALRFQGGLLQRAGRPDEALPALEEARAIIEAMPVPTNFDRINLAACLAQLEILARSSRPRPGGGAVPGRDETGVSGDRAMSLLREVADKSKPRPSRFPFLVDPDLEPLRARDDFRALMRQIGFAGSPRPRTSPIGFQRPHGPGLPAAPPDSNRAPTSESAV
jgi:tetratricopeptide (TPR) repeat protein